MASPLAEKIRQATVSSLAKRDRYDAELAAGLSANLKDVQDQVSKAILKYKSLGSLPDNKVAALTGLEKLQTEIAEVMRDLKQRQTLAFRKGTREAFRLGIGNGIGELAQAAMPFYQDLKPEGIDKLSTKVFTIVDTDALDFMTQYNLTLAGDIHRELSDGIKRTILSGIATGKGADDIVRDLGAVVLDKDSFRQAGTKVFSKAQYRMEMIARTEILRAHNMGRMKFHQRVGVQRLEWMAMDDERMCEVCGGLDGKTFDIGKFPNQPAHPHCRCTNVVAWPMSICGGDLAASAADKAGVQGDSCILPPQVLEGMADAQTKENAKLKNAFDSGNIEDLKELTVKQLQNLAKGKCIAIARTKADFMKLLDAAEPGIDHSGLGGSALMDKLKEYKIGLLRTKEDLIELLSQKQAELKQAQMLAAQMSKIPAPEGLDQLTAQKLKELAKENGISLNMTKEETIELLDKLEPGVNHQGLMGKELAALKQKHGIGILKNKQQLIEALQKKAGQDMTVQVKQQAADSAKQMLSQKQKEALTQAAQSVVVPPSPSGYSSFLDSLSKAEKAIQESPDLSPEILASHAKEIALKKKLFADQIAKLNSADLKTIAKETKVKYWQWANKDELKTLFTETDSAKIQIVQESIDKKHTAWAVKHGGGKKSESPEPKPIPKNEEPEAQKKPAPKPKEQLKPEPKQPLKKGSEFVAVDEEWKQKGLPSQFKHVGKAQVGGAHEKEFWTDAQGNKWLFKPIGKSTDEFIVHGEEAAYRIGRLIDPDAIEVRTISLGGRMGSIQKWRTDLKDEFDFRNTSPENLTTLEIEQIQREHVVDWLIGNHDGHSKQFIRAKDGKVYGIDKGQSFKFIGKDKLSTDYHPNGACGEEEPYYNKVFRAAKDGKVNFDPSVSLRYIQEVEKISDDDYLAIIKPYAEGRFAKDPAGMKLFYEQALARKHNLRSDFEGYFQTALNQKNFKFAELSTAESKKLLSAAEEQLVEEARKLGWQGKSLPFDSGDVEDQNALIFSDLFNGKERSVVKMKLRPDTDKKVEAILKKHLKPGTSTTPMPHSDDVFFDDMLAAIKTVNHHASDGNYNMPKLEKAKSFRAALEKLKKNPDSKEMAKHYLAWVDKLEKAAASKGKTDGNFSQFLVKPTPVKNTEKGPFTVTQGKITHTKRKIGNGMMTVVSDDIDNSTMFGKHSGLNEGIQYTITFEDGTKMRYRPWNSSNLYAQRGELELISEGKMSPKKVEGMLAQLESLGIDTKVASLENAEQMYLEKLAYIRKVDTTPEYKKIVASLDSREATVAERVQTLRGYWEKQLGVSDLTKLPGYDPMGKYQAGFLDKSIQGGYRHQYRFDISEEELEKKMKGYSLVHSLTNGESMSNFIELVLENNGAMVSTVEKMRMGVPPGGMSPVADMQTGGATYFFTRIKKQPPSASAGLYFKKQMLRRMDAISYSHDAYGKVVDDYVRKNRGATIDEWKDFSGKSGNETIFKYSVTLFDNIEYIVAGSDKERLEIIQSFTKRGIKKLPDGRKIEDVVHSSSTWSTRKDAV